MKQIIIFIFCITLMLGLVSAYLPHKQNTDFTLSATSNNATACNLSSIQYPDGSSIVYNLVMTKNTQLFYLTLENGNYTQLGDICHYIVCTDGTNYETGSVCRNVTENGKEKSFDIMWVALAVVFFLFIYSITGESYILTAISSMGMLVGGVYLMINGIEGSDNTLTKAISVIMLGLGVVGIFEPLWAAVGDGIFDFRGNSDED